MNIISRGKSTTVESWDDDFDAIDENELASNLQASVSSVGSRNHLLNSYSEANDDDQFFDDDDMMNEANLTTKISSVNLNRNNNANNHNHNKSINDRSDGDDEMDEFDNYQTLRRKKVNKKSSMPALSKLDLSNNNNIENWNNTIRAKKSSMMINNMNKSANRSPSKKVHSPVKGENFEDGFDVEDTECGDLAMRLQKVKNQTHVDDEESWGEESLGFRASSRLSEASSSSSRFSSSYEESEVDEFLEGVELPEKHVNFQRVLESRERDAQQVAEHEEELLMQGKKYDTIKSNGSGNSIKNLEALQDNEDEMDLDFFDGIEIDDEKFSKKNKETVNTHRNVVKKGGNSNNNNNNDRNEEKKMRIKKSMPSLRDDQNTSPIKKASFSMRKDYSLDDIPKHRSTSLRPVQSMSNFARKSSTRPKYAKPKGSKIFGDGSELDTLNELPTSGYKEQSFTVTPKTSSKYYSNIKHKPLDTYKEKEHQKRRLKTRPSKAHLKRNNKDNNKKGGPGLIQQLGPPTSSILSKGCNGDMKFNPRKLIWEGNDIELKKFESLNTKAPGLIAFISNKGVQVVGDMVFDPEKLCWIRVNGDQEKDPFEGVEDLDVSVQSKASTIRPSMSESVGDFQVGREFEINSEMIRKMQHEDERWFRKCQGWFSPDEQYDRDYLNEIRQMVMK